MSQTKEFRDNAQFCAARAAEVAQSEQDRAAWMRLSLAWQALADLQELRRNPQRAISGGVASHAGSAIIDGLGAVLSMAAAY